MVLDNVVSEFREQLNIVQQIHNNEITKINEAKSKLQENLNLSKTEIHGLDVEQTIN